MLNDIFFWGESIAKKNERKYGICSRCEGKGIVEESEIASYGEDGGDDIWETVRKACPRCNGTGKYSW